MNPLKLMGSQGGPVTPVVKPDNFEVAIRMSDTKNVTVGYYDMLVDAYAKCDQLGASSLVYIVDHDNDDARIYNDSPGVRNMLADPAKQDMLKRDPSFWFCYKLSPDMYLKWERRRIEAEAYQGTAEARHRRSGQTYADCLKDYTTPTSSELVDRTWVLVPLTT